MSKLFKLREWLTIPDTVKHLSVVCGEEVAEADVYRLALDGHLTLSVNFVNQANANRGKNINWEETEWIRIPPLMQTDNAIISAEGVTPDKFAKFPPKLQALYDEISETERKKFMFLMQSECLNNDRFVNFDKKIITIEGIWDLLMFGGEQLDVENKYQILTGGPAVTLETLDGCFVEKPDGQICKLLDSFDDNEYRSGSIAAYEKLKEKIKIEGIEETEAERLLEQHKKAQKKYLEERKLRPKEDDYYPAGGLPSDSVFVVRTAALRDFEQLIADSDDKSTKNTKESTRKTENLLKAITAIAIDDYGYSPESAKSSAPQEIADAMRNQGAKFDPKTIRGWLKEGTKLLPQNPKEN